LKKFKYRNDPVVDWSCKYGVNITAVPNVGAWGGGSTKCSKYNTYANRISIVLQNVHDETALGYINDSTVSPTQHILICYTHRRLGRSAPRAKE